MSFAKCPLCGASVELHGAHAGDEVQCSQCNCTFNAPARRVKKPAEGAAAPVKTKAARSEPSAFSKYLTENHESLLRWGKLAGVIVVGLILAAALLQGLSKWGEKFEREADKNALSYDIRSTLKQELARARNAKIPSMAPLISVESMELDWDDEQSGTVPFATVVMADADNRKRVTLYGELHRPSGKWFATRHEPGTVGWNAVAESDGPAEGILITPEGGGIRGTITASESSTRMFAVIVLVIIGLAVMMIGKAMIKR